MWYFTKAADWWDSQKKESDDILDKWVEDSNYSQGAMIVAASTKALTTFGAGFVDVLRLGDGVKQGTLKGVGTDALRAIAIFPVGKAAQVLKSAQGVRAAKFILDPAPGCGICAWVASAKALAQTGQKFNGRLFASVDDLAQALGVKELGGINLTKVMANLQMLGAKVGKVRAVSSVHEVEAMIPPDGSLVMIGVRLERNGAVVDHHAIYAYRTALGHQVRYMDRTVGNGIPLPFKSMSDVAHLYEAIFIPEHAAVIYNVFVKSVGHEAPRLVMPILGIIATQDDKIATQNGKNDTTSLHSMR